MFHTSSDVQEKKQGVLRGPMPLICASENDVFDLVFQFELYGPYSVSPGFPERLAGVDKKQARSIISDVVSELSGVDVSRRTCLR